MYSVEDRSCAWGCAKTSARYSPNAITRRLRVKSSRTAACRPSSVDLTSSGMSVTGLTISVCRNGDRDRLLLRMAAFLIAHAELEHALDLVRAGLVGGRVHGEREQLLAERRRVALRLVVAARGQLGLRELHAVGRLEDHLDRELGRDVAPRRRRDLDVRDEIRAGLAPRLVDRQRALVGRQVKPGVVGRWWWWGRRTAADATGNRDLFGRLGGRDRILIGCGF